MTELAEPLVVPDVAKVAGVEDCTAVINGIRWRYLHAGSGPALLVVHGFMGYSFSWRFVIKGLAQHYSVYAVDLPGCGFSQRSASLPGTLASDAEHLLDFHGPLRHRAVRRARHFARRRSRDRSGWTAGRARHAASHPEAGVVGADQSLDAIRAGAHSPPAYPRRPHLRGASGAQVSLHPRRTSSASSTPTRRPFLLTPSPATRPDWSLPGSFEHLWNIIRSWMNDLKRIEAVLPLVESVPTLLLWGDRDRAVAPSSMHELHRRWKNSAECLMTPIGHMPYEEVPEEFNRIVLDFLLRDTPATPLQARSASGAGADSRSPAAPDVCLISSRCSATTSPLTATGRLPSRCCWRMPASPCPAKPCCCSPAFWHSQHHELNLGLIILVATAGLHARRQPRLLDRLPRRAPAAASLPEILPRLRREDRSRREAVRTLRPGHGVLRPLRLRHANHCRTAGRCVAHARGAALCCSTSSAPRCGSRSFRASAISLGSTGNGLLQHGRPRQCGVFFVAGGRSSHGLRGSGIGSRRCASRFGSCDTRLVRRAVAPISSARSGAFTRWPPRRERSAEIHGGNNPEAKLQTVAVRGFSRQQRRDRSAARWPGRRTCSASVP